MRSLLKRAARACGADIRGIHNVGEETFLNLPRKGIDQILDVGANDGGFARLALARFPGAYIHCFEPLEGPRRRLEAWIARESNGRAKAWPFALSNVDGAAECYLHVDHPASSSLLHTTTTGSQAFPQTTRQQKVTIQTRTLDRWVTEESIQLSSRCLLKVDVQGFESQVLRGGTQTLRGVFACVLEVNVVPLYEGQARFSDLVRMLSEAGLDYVGNLSQTHDKDGQPLFLDAVFERSEH